MQRAKKMDAIRQRRLQLTVPMPIKTGKVGLTVLFFRVRHFQMTKKSLTRPLRGVKTLEAYIKVFKNKYLFNCFTFSCRGVEHICTSNRPL